MPNHLEIENLRYNQLTGGMTTYSSAGLHPWFLSEMELDLATSWLRDQATLPRVIAIGEAGLDKVTDTPWDLQVTAFQRCVVASEAFKKPLLIHCVRAFAEIIALKKKWQPVQPWIFHGYNRGAIMSEILLKEDCYLSFGKALFHAKSKASDALRMTPDERFFLETDDDAFPLEAIYQRAAEILGASVEAVQKIQVENFRRVFHFL